MDLNRATIIGRLTRDPELRSLPSGKSVCTITIATSRVWTDAQGQKQKQSEFHNVVLWAKLADVTSQYLRKGSQVYLEGRIQTREWTGQDNVKRWRTEIIGDNMIMLGSPSGTRGAEPAAVSGSNNFAQPTPDVIEEEIKVEDIPF